jgi:hypothetical protein
LNKRCYIRLHFIAVYPSNDSKFPVRRSKSLISGTDFNRHDRTIDIDTVNVRVGLADAAVNISFYRDVLSAVSPYIRGAFKSPFRETTDHSLSLTDITKQTFRIFLQRAHTHKYQQSSGAATPRPGMLLQESTT